MSLLLGDCLAWLDLLPDNHVDAVVTDPPYGLSPDGRARTWDDIEEGQARGGFMGKGWDGACPGVTWAKAVLRVTKPGGHLVAFGGQRTIHRLTCALEDAGWEIRDQIGWQFWSGFPKSLDVGKAIDSRPGAHLHPRFADELTAARLAAGLSRAELALLVVGTKSGAVWNWEHHQFPESRHWGALAAHLPTLDRSWGTVLEEAERVVTGVHATGLAAGTAGVGGSGSGGDRRDTPATDDARRWSGWGSGLKPSLEPAILCRKPLSESTIARNVLRWGCGAINVDGCRYAYGDGAWPGPQGEVGAYPNGPGGNTFSVGDGPDGKRDQPWENTLGRFPANVYAVAKASRAERERGCQSGGARMNTGRESIVTGHLPTLTGAQAVGRAEGSAGLNPHPCVKPVRLMRWLSRLVCPPGGLVLDSFLGSGSTGVAAHLEGFEFIGIEREPEYMAIAEARIAHAIAYPDAWADTEPGADRTQAKKASDTGAERALLERNGQAGLFG